MTSVKFSPCSYALCLMIASVSTALAQEAVSECGVLSGAGTSWFLTQDLIAPRSTGDCLSLVSPNMTLDLRGHTITYDADPTGIPNGGFEEGLPGNPGLPAEWDLTAANGRVQRVSTGLLPMVDGYFLEFVNSQPGDEVRSPWVELPPDRACSVSFIVGFSAESFPVMPAVRLIVERSTGDPVYDATHRSDPAEPSLLRQRFPFRTPDVDGETYRLRLIVDQPPVTGQFHHRFAFDDVHLRTDGNFGIEVQAAAVGARIENGRIVQGAGGGPYASAIRVADGTRLLNVQVETHGIESMAVLSPIYISDVEIAYCDLRSLAPAAFRWMDLKNTVTLGGSSIGSSNNWIHDNTVVGGRGLGCIRVAGGSGNNPPAYKIENNELFTSSALTDHHAIVVYRSPNAIVRANTIQADGGQGILLSSGFGGADVAHNVIVLDGIRPNIEYGLISFDAIRMNDYVSPDNRSDGVHVHDNSIYVGGGLDPHFAPRYGVDCGVIPTPGACAGKVLNGIMHSANGIGTELSRNAVTVRITDPRVIGSCWEIGRSDPAGGEVAWRDNSCDSNQKLMVIGGYARAARNSRFVGTTLRRVTPSVGLYHTLFSRGSQPSIDDVSFVSSTFEGGASLEQSDTYMRTYEPYEFSQGWMLRVRVTRPSGVPVSGQPVSIRDALGRIVFSGVTAPSGWLEDVQRSDEFEMVQWSRSGPAWQNTGTTVMHTPHIVTVGESGPSLVVTMDRDRTAEITWARTGMRGHNVDLPPSSIAAVEEAEERAAEPGGAARIWSVTPNPFNPRTRIRFELGRNAGVTLEVLDMRGALVTTVYSRTLPSGLHEVVWDGRDDGGQMVSSGVYFVRMRSGGGEDVRKVVLLR